MLVDEIMDLKSFLDQTSPTVTFPSLTEHVPFTRLQQEKS